MVLLFLILILFFISNKTSSWLLGYCPPFLTVFLFFLIGLDRV
ncbi:hypothetical protein Gohar_024099 [Gossypium harknessii]|uniref:Uncharacterized protein n=1 Tax=Gossypium harknessii TaxID=34285 RepID=A0A7J9HEY5_9ROSI|nr:hypothetical protein [Gossypium harknessii]